MSNITTIQKTMTSTELLEIINTAREDAGRSKIRHNDFSRSIRQKFGSGVTSTREATKNKAIRQVVILSQEQAEQAMRHYATGSISFGAMEHAALSAIEQVLGVTLKRQHQCGPYRIDGWDAAGNVAYEIDEQHHKLQGKNDAARQEFIERELGCRFVRIEV